MARTVKLIPSLSESDKRRFLDQISKTQTDAGCLEWTGKKDKDGYGRFRNGAYMFGAHRISFHLFFGIDPVNLVVRHACHNPSCCNPDHLSAGTQKDNMDDRRNAGRTAKGGKNGRAKLAEPQVIAIRDDARSLRKIAVEYGVDPTVIGDIKNRKLWAHVA